MAVFVFLMRKNYQNVKIDANGQEWTKNGQKWTKMDKEWTKIDKN